MGDCICLTDWAEVEKDEYYLSDDWLVDKMGSYSKKEARELRKKAQEGELFTAYVAPAKSVALYSQFDSEFVIIDKEGDIVVRGEGTVTNSDAVEKWETDC
jgi:hypothetical protein